mmetsp:Transcript_50716/g.74174  ORF Transcript_50716/g.74174 Transcript_50716/m.74174 type:complete len:139 (+) Transcript_50716:35-451(+)
MAASQNPPSGAGEEGVKTEIHGFVALIAVLVSYAMYLVWAYVPEEFLHKLGITYYPSKYWAIAVPVYCCVAAFFVGFVYVAANLVHTEPLSSFHTMVDEHSLRCPSQYSSEEGMPDFSDIDLGVANSLMFDQKQAKDS